MGISVYGIRKFGLIKKPLGVGKGRVAVTIPVKILALPEGGGVKLILAMPVFSLELL